MSKVKFHANRAAGFCTAIVTYSLLLVINITMASGLIPGLSPEIDKQQEVLIRRETMDITVEGQFVDRNGDPITEPGGPGEIATIIEDECYSYLVGYRTQKRDLSGLRKQLMSYLFFGGTDGVGSRITLTTDNGLQSYCYGILGNREGSVIVMDAKTGELLAFTSRSSAKMGYDADLYTKNYNEYNSYPAFWYNRSTMTEDPPGSTFKIITSAALLENGMGGYIYDDLDGSYEVDGGAIHNAYGKIYGAGVDMEKALNKSVNVYFSSAAVDLGAHRLNSILSKFRFNEYIVTDFGRIKSTFKMKDMSSKGELAQAGYGQGSLAMSPLHIAMVMGTVLNDGVMTTPYVIQEIYDDGVDRIGEIHQAETVSRDTRVFSSETAATLKQYLHSTAISDSYGFTEEKFGMVYAKTGTADLTNGKNHAYMLIGLETEARDYAILIDVRNADVTSGSLKNSAVAILEYILSMQSDTNNAA